MRGGAPGVDLRRARLASAAAATLLLWVMISGCYRLTIDESYWLRARPAPAVAAEQLRQAAPAGVRIRPFTVERPGEPVLHGFAAVRADALASVLFFGGDSFVLSTNGEAALRSLASAAAVNVAMVDYRGSGGSGGEPSLEALRADALATFDRVVAEPHFSARPVVVHGHSLGSFVAAHVAQQRAVDGLVLQGSATDPTEWARSFLRPSRFRWWARPAYPFLRVRIAPALLAEDNRARLSLYEGPLLVLVGGDDDVTEPAMSRALHAAAATPDSLKRLVVLDRAGHENVLEHPGFGAAYAAFIEAVVDSRRAGSPAAARP